MYAVGGIDAQTSVAFVIVDHFIYMRGTKAFAGIAKLLRAALHTQVGIGDMQMNRLMFIVSVAGKKHR